MLIKVNKSKNTKRSFIDDQKQPGLVLTMLWCGFLVGWLDIVSAILNTWIPYHVGPVVVLRFIASGLFGQAAFAGGTEMAIYGLLLHFMIAYAFTIPFFLLYPKFPILAKSKILTGVFYGIFIWAVMNLGVIPLTLIPKGHMQVKSVILGIVILIVMIGLPLSYITNGYYANKPPKQ